MGGGLWHCSHIKRFGFLESDVQVIRLESKQQARAVERQKKARAPQRLRGFRGSAGALGSRRVSWGSWVWDFGTIFFYQNQYRVPSSLSIYLLFLLSFFASWVFSKILFLPLWSEAIRIIMSPCSNLSDCGVFLEFYEFCSVQVRHWVFTPKDFIHQCNGCTSCSRSANSFDLQWLMRIPSMGVNWLDWARRRRKRRSWKRSRKKQRKAVPVSCRRVHPEFCACSMFQVSFCLCRWSNLMIFFWEAWLLGGWNT